MLRAARANCRRVALLVHRRACSSSGSGGGSSGSFIGVREDEETGTYKSVIIVDGAEVHGGTFSSAEEAARSYDLLVRVFEGNAADTNFGEALPVWDEEMSTRKEKPESPVPIRER